MLVLSRKLNGIIRIGDCIVVTVIRLSGSTVQLMISAPLEIPIRRGELTGVPAASAADATEPEAEADSEADDGFVEGTGLVLSRKKNETIVINDVIVITVVEIKGSTVRLGIEAPREVPVHRKEVSERIAAGD